MTEVYRWKDGKFYHFINNEDNTKIYEAHVLKGNRLFGFRRRSYFTPKNTSLQFKAMPISRLNLKVMKRISKWEWNKSGLNPAQEWINSINQDYFKEALKYPTNDSQNLFCTTPQGKMFRLFNLHPEMLEISKRFPFCAMLFEKCLPNKYTQDKTINPTKTFMKKFLKLSDAEKVHYLLFLNSNSITISEVKNILSVLKKFTHKTCDFTDNVHNFVNQIKIINQCNNSLNHFRKINSIIINTYAMVKRENVSKQDVKRFFPYLNWLSTKGHCKNKKGHSYNSSLQMYLSDIIRIEKLLRRANFRFKQPKITHKNIVEHHDYLAIEQQKIREANIVFPEPPIPGTDYILPVTESHKLFEEGTVMHHCVNSYKTEILLKRSYIYHIEKEEEKATLEIRKRDDNYWTLAQVRGICNKNVSKDIMNMVVSWAEENNITTTVVNQLWF